MLNLPTTLSEKLPAFLADNFSGYFRKTDPTVLSFNTLTFPSVNCTIPDVDKIVPDKGKLLLGQTYTENSGIIGNKEKFKNLGGIETEIRVWRSSEGDLYGGRKDVIEFLFVNPNIASSFYNVPHWYQITENINPLPIGAHEYYFDDWWDSNLDTSLSKNLSRCIWVNGYQNPTTKKGLIFSWTGGIAVIDSLTATTLTVANNETWRSLGFTEDASGNAFIIVNGVSYQLANPSDLDTDTINVTDTSGISLGDVATSKIETDIAPIPFDVCRQNKGYMFYGNWKFRDLYMSNAFNRPDKITITSFAGTQNDLVLRDTAHYTGTKESIFHVTIDSVAPDEQSFFGTGVNNGYYNTSGYAAGYGTHTFKFSFVADMTITYAGAGGFSFGEIIEGATANDLARVFWDDTVNGRLALIYISGTFAAGDTITGQSSGTTETVVTSYFIGWYQFLQDDTLVFQPAGTASEVALGTNSLLFTGLSIFFGSVVGHNVGDYFQLDIGNQDTFAWQKDDGPQTSGVAITGGYQTLSDGVRIKFVNKRGHSVGDTWDITASPEVKRAWANYYYALPIRKPGEGYIFHLTSNFWAMDTQEEQMYVNTSFGRWIIIDTVLSADLQSESVSAEPLKQAGSNKVLYPYLTGHLENFLVYVTVDHNLDFIGRQALLEKPQIDNLSDPVKLDFTESSFIGGRISYIGKRLYISSPEQGITHCYDYLKSYWQPPKLFPEVGILSIVENTLIAHSNTRNQTFTMFADDSDNGLAYLVRVRTPYSNVGSRWKSKSSNMSFTEGYMTGAPPITHKVYLDVNGCTNILTHTLEPIICLAPDRAPIGEGPLGSHSNGSDQGTTNSYFQEIYPKYKQPFSYHFIAIELECHSTNHTYEYLSFGLNAIYDPTNNNDITVKGSVLP